MDHDTYSAHNAIGKVYISLNSLGEGGTQSSGVLDGWFPIYDTLHGTVQPLSIMNSSGDYPFPLSPLSTLLPSLPSLPSLSPLPLPSPPSLSSSFPLSPPSPSPSFPPSPSSPPKGIRGEVRLIVKVEILKDQHRFRQSSCDIMFFSCMFQCTAQCCPHPAHPLTGCGHNGMLKCFDIETLNFSQQVPRPPAVSLPKPFMVFWKNW